MIKLVNLLNEIRIDTNPLKIGQKCNIIMENGTYLPCTYEGKGDLYHSFEIKGDSEHGRIGFTEQEFFEKIKNHEIIKL